MHDAGKFCNMTLKPFEQRSAIQNKLQVSIKVRSYHISTQFKKSELGLTDWIGVSKKDLIDI